MTPLYFDTETYSEADLRKVGSYKYARDPSTEIIIAQWAVGDDEPTVIDCTDGRRIAELIDLLLDPQLYIVAHNGGAFDRPVLRHCWGLDIPPERWLDTMVAAYMHSLPGALDKVGEALGIDTPALKDKRGTELIRLFCKPRPRCMRPLRATSKSHPREWAAFLEYSRQDIVAMRAVHKRLPTWNFHIGHPEHTLWCLDQRMNDRGFMIDRRLAHGAIAVTAAEQRRLNDAVSDATDGLVPSASKRDALLAYILVDLGCNLPDLRASTLREVIGSGQLPPEAERLLELRLESSKTSTAKYRAALDAADDEDDRVRGGTQFAGAQRTARWAGRLVQPQNFPRPSRDYSADEYEALCQSVASGAARLA